MATTTRVPKTTLPEVGEQSADDHDRLSTRFTEHTVIEKRKGNRLQASEKIWASVAQAIKAVGAARGWRHEYHADLKAIATQLGREQGQENDYESHFTRAESMHRNFYENESEWDQIDRSKEDADEFIKKLRSDRLRIPRPFTIETRADQRRLHRLVGKRGQPLKDFAIGKTDPMGFFGQTRPTKRRAQARSQRSNPNQGVKATGMASGPCITVRKRR